jgi:hypothetical protein
MELVFVRIKESTHCENAYPFVEQFAKQSNLKLTIYFSENSNIPAQFDKKEYPILYYVEDGKILGSVKGFTNLSYQLKNYINELNYIKGVVARPEEPIIIENNK